MPLRHVSTVAPCRPLPPIGHGRGADAQNDFGRDDFGHDDLAGFPGAEVARLSAARLHLNDRRHVPAGGELVSEYDDCDSVYLVMSGWMVLSRILEDGRQQVLDFVLPGAFVGDPVSPVGMMGYSVEAVTDAEVAVISRRQLQKLIPTVPSLALVLLKSAHGALANAYDGLTDVGRRTAKEAVASFLYRMERRIREALGTRADGSIEFPLTQAAIADALGLTPEHVCRMMRTLKADGVVAVQRGGFRILDAGKLEALAGVFADDDGMPGLRMAG